MKKHMLFLISFLCLSDQVLAIYNPFHVVLLVPGRAAAVAAYLGNKVGVVSQDNAQATQWLHEDDALRWTLFYEESLENIRKKSLCSSVKNQKKESDTESDILAPDLQKKVEKIVQLKKTLESYIIEMGLNNAQAICTILDDASKNIIQLHELQKINLTNELLLKDISVDQEFLSWFHVNKNNMDLLAQVREERDATLHNFSSLIIDDKKLQSLENRITNIIHAPQLDFSTHVSLARQHHKKEVRLYLTALGTYAMDLCACKNAEDYITIGAGGLGFLGFMSLMSKNNSEFSKLVYVGCGGATSLVAKKLYSQFLCEDDTNISIDLMQTNLSLSQNRLENLRRNMNDTISRLCSDLNKEFRDYKQDARCERIEQGVNRANNGVVHLQAGQDALQSSVIEGFDRVERNQQEQLSKAELLQQSLTQLKDQVSNLGGDTEKTNLLLLNLSSKFDVSEEKIRAWLNAESDARNEFEARSLQKLSLLDEIAANSRLQLLLAQASAAQQKPIQHFDRSIISIPDAEKIELK